MVLDSAVAVPLGNEPVYRRERIVGRTTSAAFGYRVGRPVALAMLDAEGFGETGEWRVQIDIAGTRYSATIAFEPAFDPKGTRIRS